MTQQDHYRLLEISAELARLKYALEQVREESKKVKCPMCESVQDICEVALL